jgi:hypothetical protein
MQKDKKRSGIRGVWLKQAITFHQTEQILRLFSNRFFCKIEILIIGYHIV